MSFPALWIEEKLVTAFDQKKLGHSFLLTGADLLSLQNLFYSIAFKLLDTRPLAKPADEDAISRQRASASPERSNLLDGRSATRNTESAHQMQLSKRPISRQHPDLHLIQPESKTRRILIDQIRDLQHAIQLKSSQASCKVVGIFAADRMCAGSAEAAQAFLKTLEEPPENTLLFLLTEEPELLLPTIRSRCLLLPLKATPVAPSPALIDLYKNWEQAPGSAVDKAYRRAALLSGYWNDCKANLEENFKPLFKHAETEEAEKTLTAQIESQTILARDASLSYITTQMLEKLHQGQVSLTDFERAVQSIDELRSALALNLDPALALERCCLKIGGVV